MVTSGQEKFDLSQRELEIVSAVAARYTNKEISENLKLGPNTVKLSLVSIFEKLGVTTRTQLALLWFKRGPGGFPQK